MFNGMAGDLLSGQIDLIIASFTLTAERSQAIQYLPPIGQEKGALFVRSDDTETVFSWFMFVEPFTTALWLMILVVALINASFISLINYFYKKQKQVAFTYYHLQMIQTFNPKNEIFSLLSINCFETFHEMVQV